MVQNLSTETTELDELEFGTVMTFPDGTGTLQAEIVIHPPNSTAENEFSFVVENVGSMASDPFYIEFETPADVMILKVFPFDARVARNSVVIESDGLTGGERLSVHIKTSPSGRGGFAFQTRVRMEQLHSFDVQTSQSPLPELSTPASRVPFQMASTNGNSGITHRLTDWPISDKTEHPTQPESDRFFDDHPESLISQATLVTTLTGTEVMIEGKEHEFEIIVRNQAAEMAEDIVVQLALPDGLMVTNLDRKAWIDQQARTISWKLDRIGADQAETIHLPCDGDQQRSAASKNRRRHE